MRLLIKNRPQWFDLNAPMYSDGADSSQTLLHLAVQRNQLDMVRLLAGELRADVDVCDRMNGFTPLSYAVRNRNVDMARVLLVDYGAATHLIDTHGRSLLSLACRYNVESVVCISWMPASLCLFTLTKYFLIHVDLKGRDAD